MTEPYNPATRDVIDLVASRFAATGEVNTKLVVWLIEHGNSLVTVSNMTGIGKELLRDAVRR